MYTKTIARPVRINRASAFSDTFYLYTVLAGPDGILRIPALHNEVRMSVKETVFDEGSGMQLLLEKGLHRLDDMLRPAAMSGMISDMLTASMAKRPQSGSQIN